MRYVLSLPVSRRSITITARLRIAGHGSAQQGRASGIQQGIDEAPVISAAARATSISRTLDQQNSLGHEFPVEVELGVEL